MEWFITGDTHGAVITRIKELEKLERNLVPKDTGVIILGDNGLNIDGSNREEFYKDMLNRMGYQIYCLRGNHDMRPELVKGIEYDETHHLLYEPHFPNIHYFLDGFTYTITIGKNTYHLLTIGGAYSVDKNYRLRYNLPWFSNEQLTQEEQEIILEKIKGKYFDFVLTHTCPYKWHDNLKLEGNFTEIDYSMEKFFDKVESSIAYDRWLFGHYHGTYKVTDKSWTVYTQILNMKEFTEFGEPQYLFGF